MPTNDLLHYLWGDQQVAGAALGRYTLLGPGVELLTGIYSGKHPAVLTLVISGEAAPSKSP